MSIDAEPAPPASAIRDADPAAGLARRMIEFGETPPPTLPAERRLALAWELKDLCYAAWSSEPQRAATAAEALRRLCAVPGPDAVPTRQQREIEALADWTAGIACLTRGDMSGASASFRPCRRNLPRSR